MWVAIFEKLRDAYNLIQGLEAVSKLIHVW